MKRIFFVSGMVIISLCLLSTCGKKKTESYKTTSEDNSSAENLFADVFNQIDDAAKGQANAGAKNEQHLALSPCASVTFSPNDSLTFPKTMTIDFGTTNCTGVDGRNRRGKIIVNMTGKYRATGSVFTVTFDNFYINDNKLMGTKTITNNGRNLAGNLNWTIKVTDAEIVLSDGRDIKWNSTRTREWIKGESTRWPIITDDEYSISGSASGTNSVGTAYTVEITSPLIVKLNCRYISQGVIEITPDGLEKRVIDYGDGTCDAKATLTIRNKTYDILLR